MYINCGAIVGWERPKTRRELLTAIANSPGIVVFDRTSIFDTGDNFGLDEVRPGTRLTVVGPDPYTDRRWYATIFIKQDGTFYIEW